MSYLLVGAGGAAGAMLRYFVAGLFSATFPWATAVINVSGSLAMGLLVGVLARTLPPVHEELRLLLAVGVLGGFTTFSAFSLDAVTLWERGDLGGAAAYVLASVVLSIVALFLGLALTRVGT